MPSQKVPKIPRRKPLAVIVHPEFKHTLPAEPTRLSFWEALPDSVLHHVAEKLDAQALALMELVNQRCRYDKIV